MFSKFFALKRESFRAVGGGSEGGVWKYGGERKTEYIRRREKRELRDGSGNVNNLMELRRAGGGEWGGSWN